jgi:hypothetical protein
MKPKGKRQKPLGRQAHQGKVSKVGQSWGTEYVLVSSLSNHQTYKIPIGPGKCTCNRPGNEIRYVNNTDPVCEVCGLSFGPRPSSPIHPTRNRTKSAKRFLKKISY